MGALAAGVAVLTCFAVSKDLVVFLEAPVASQGVRFLQLSPGEFFFTTLKVAPCMSGLLHGVRGPGRDAESACGQAMPAALQLWPLLFWQTL